MADWRDKWNSKWFGAAKLSVFNKHKPYMEMRHQKRINGHLTEAENNVSQALVKSGWFCIDSITTKPPDLDTIETHLTLWRYDGHE